MEKQEGLTLFHYRLMNSVIKRMIFFMSVIFSSSGFSSEKSPKIVVVGGGIAGLTTAYRLQKGGMEVDLYEARGRVGGRLYSKNKESYC